MDLDLMAQIPQFSGHYQEIYEFLDIEFSGGSTNSIAYATSPSSISFMGSPVQEPMTQFLQPKFSPTAKFKRSRELFSEKSSSVEAMREMIFQIAAMQPIQIDPESVKPPQRRNVKISKDPQSVAARHRRGRISERIRILQRLVPGGTKMDTASMLDEAVHYMKFLKKQVQSLERAAGSNVPINVGYQTTMATAMNMNYSPMAKACQPAQMVGSMRMLS